MVSLTALSDPAVGYGGMAEKQIDAWQMHDWNETLFQHYFAEHSDNTTVTRLAVTGEEISKAVKGVVGSEEARAYFIAALVRGLGHRSLGSDAQRKAASWDVDSESPPPFVAHLLFTCLVVGDMAEQLESVGDFRKRLTLLLGWGTGHGLDRLPPLWRSLSDWLKLQYENRRPFKRLLLPSPSPSLAIIGYQYGLAFPTRRDQERLRKVLSDDHLLGSEPLVTRVFNLLERRLSLFTPQFQKTYREFRDLYHVSPHSASAATAFWSVIRDVALKSGAEETSRARLPKLQLVLEIDIETYSLAVMSSREFSVKGFTTVEFPSGLSDYPFLVTDTEDEPVDVALLKAAYGPAAALPAIFRDLATAISDRILLFVPDEAGQMYVLARNLPEGGKVVGLVKADLLHNLEIALQSAALETQWSLRRSDAYPGWHEFEISDGAALSYVDFSANPALSEIPCLQVILKPSRMVFVGGAKLGESYLGLIRFLPDVVVEGADAVSAEAIDQRDSIALRRTPTVGTWRFPSDPLAFPLHDSYQLRAFVANELVDQRPIAFSPEVRNTEYVAPSNPQLWLGEGGFGESASPSGWPVAPGDCFEDDERKDRSVIRQSSPEPGRPESVPQNPVVDELISFLAARSSNQQGILEYELVGFLKEHLSLDWNRAWHVYRAWVEIGTFEALSLRTWRVRKCFARKPCLVAYLTPGGYRIALFGLVPPAIRTTFELACESLNCCVLRKPGLSPCVPILSMTGVNSVEEMRELARRCGVERVVWLKDLSEIAMPIASVPGASGEEPLNWELHRFWDFKQHLFVRPQDGDVKQPVALLWHRRSDRSDYFSVSQTGSPVWWGWSKTWALLRAYDLVGEVPFTKAGRQSLKTDIVHVHLPLPLARALAITGPFLPGPCGADSKDFSYLYSFPSENLRGLAMEFFWTNVPRSQRYPAALSADLQLLWRMSTTYRPDALPLPVLLRDKLASDPLLRRFATLQVIPRSVLPILLTLTSGVARSQE